MAPRSLTPATTHCGLDKSFSCLDQFPQVLMKGGKRTRKGAYFILCAHTNYLLPEHSAEKISVAVS